VLKRAIVLRCARQYKAYNVNNLDRLNRVVTISHARPVYQGYAND